MKQDTANYKFIKQQHRGTSQSNPVHNSIDINRKMIVCQETPWCEKDVKGKRKAGGLCCKSMYMILGPDPGERNYFSCFQPTISLILRKSAYFSSFRLKDILLEIL